MPKRRTTYELESACCKLGYAAESLLFLAKFHWLRLRRDAPFPKSLPNHMAVIDTCLRSLSERTPNARVRHSTQRLRNATLDAMTDLNANWRSERRSVLQEFLERSDDECIPDIWFEENSLLSQTPWQDVLSARRSLERSLPNGLAACFSTGDLVSRIERLVRDAVDEETPGERYPVLALEETLVKLRDHYFAMLKDLNITLGDSIDGTGLHLDEAQRRATEIYEELIRRFERTEPCRKMTVDQANVAVIAYIEKNPSASQREIAAGIGCSHGLVGKTNAWKLIQELRAPKSKKASGLSDAVLDNTATKDKQLEELMNDQRKDYESSPLEFGKAPRNHKSV